MKFRLFAVLAVFMLILACSPKIVPTTPVFVGTILSPELVEGKGIFENNCANCHDLYAPQDFTAEQWKPILLRMQIEAKISDEEREKVYAYLTKL
jgi:cytochrome c5